MIKLSAFASNLKAEADGEWVEIAELPGVKFKVRGIGYPPFQTDLKLVRARLIRKYPGTKPIPAEEEDVENGRLYAKHLLLDWQGIEEGYTPELAMQALTDPASRQLRGQVAWCASRVGAAPIEAMDILGNSNAASGGGSKVQDETPSGSNA